MQKEAERYEFFLEAEIKHKHFIVLGTNEQSEMMAESLSENTEIISYLPNVN